MEKTADERKKNHILPSTFCSLFSSNLVSFFFFSHNYADDRQRPVNGIVDRFDQFISFRFVSLMLTFILLYTATATATAQQKKNKRKKKKIASNGRREKKSSFETKQFYLFLDISNWNEEDKIEIIETQLTQWQTEIENRPQMCWTFYRVKILS